MQGQADRVNYLMTKQAKIVAMTCTHAALKRREFLQLGLKYDNLLMEESAQILEIETFIPMLLQVSPFLSNTLVLDCRVNWTRHPGCFGNQLACCCIWLWNLARLSICRHHHHIIPSKHSIC